VANAGHAHSILPGVPEATWRDYAGRTPAAVRLQHHLLAAALTADEMCPEGFWNVHLQGKAGAWRPSFVMFNFTDLNRHDDRTVCHFANGHLRDKFGREIA
jgi:hypothetical protein